MVIILSRNFFQMATIAEADNPADSLIKAASDTVANLKAKGAEIVDGALKVEGNHETTTQLNEANDKNKNK